jgi:hypothetical protein
MIAALGILQFKETGPSPIDVEPKTKDTIPKICAACPLSRKLEIAWV